MNTNSVRKQFEHVKSTFFPRWDKGGDWRVEFRSHDSPHGFRGAMCEPETKTIYVSDFYEDEFPNVSCVLIHEISHAVAGGHHGKRWQERMEVATRKADEVGDNDLAECLRAQVHQYRTSAFKPRAKNVYNQIIEAVQVAPDLTLDQVLNYVAWNNQLTVGELTRRFKRARKVYEETREDAGLT